MVLCSKELLSTPAAMGSMVRSSGARMWPHTGRRPHGGEQAAPENVEPCVLRDELLEPVLLWVRNGLPGWTSESSWRVVVIWPRCMQLGSEVQVA